MIGSSVSQLQLKTPGIAYNVHVYLQRLIIVNLSFNVILGNPEFQSASYKGTGVESLLNIQQVSLICATYFTSLQSSAGFCKSTYSKRTVLSHAICCSSVTCL